MMTDLPVRLRVASACLSATPETMQQVARITDRLRLETPSVDIWELLRWLTHVLGREK